jgi:uncharacterized protein YerC
MSEIPKTPAELVAALQSAAGSAANVVSPQALAELPQLLLTAATLLQRTNEILDRVDKLMTIAEPAVATIDRVAPMLEDLAATTHDIRDRIGSVPGLGRLKKD